MRREEARNFYHEPVDGDARETTASSSSDDESTLMLRRRPRLQPGPTTDGAAIVLIVLGGSLQGKVLVLRNGDNMVGRAEDADVSIDDCSVSRRHARIRVDEHGRVDLVDLGSTNGTFVDGVRVTCESLRIGARIRLGFEVVLELGQVSRAEAAESAALDQDASAGQVAMEPREPGRAEPGDSKKVASYARLLEIRRRRVGEHHVSVAELLETMGVALQSDGLLERASACLTRALEIHEIHEPMIPQTIARLLGRLASCDLALDRPQVAVARLERAEQLLRGTLATAADLGTTRLMLSQVLWRLGRDHERSIELARRARDVLADGGTKTHLLHHGAQAWFRSITREPRDEQES